MNRRDLQEQATLRKGVRRRAAKKPGRKDDWRREQELDELERLMRERPYGRGWSW